MIEIHQRLQSLNRLQEYLEAKKLKDRIKMHRILIESNYNKNEAEEIIWNEFDTYVTQDAEKQVKSSSKWWLASLLTIPASWPISILLARALNENSASNWFGGAVIMAIFLLLGMILAIAFAITSCIKNEKFAWVPASILGLIIMAFIVLS